MLLASTHAATATLAMCAARLKAAAYEQANGYDAQLRHSVTMQIISVVKRTRKSDVLVTVASLTSGAGDTCCSFSERLRSCGHTHTHIRTYVSSSAASAHAPPLLAKTPSVCVCVKARCTHCFELCVSQRPGHIQARIDPPSDDKAPSRADPGLFLRLCGLVINCHGNCLAASDQHSPAWARDTHTHTWYTHLVHDSRLHACACV